MDLHEDILRQLHETGRFSEPVCDEYARLMAAFFHSLAEQLDVTPEQAYLDHYPTICNAPDAPQAALAGALSPGDAAEAARLWREMAAESPYFKRWFKDSKVVDELGKPRIVYRGMMDEIRENKFWVRKDGGTYGAGIYFSKDPSVASFWAGFMEEDGIPNEPGGAVYPCYLAITNPASGREAEEVEALFQAAARDELIRRGYDGIITENDEIVAFWPEQIKSAIGNDGTFNPYNPQILLQSAWHGSPHRFERFDSAFNARGDGSNLFGHGHYLTAQRETAERYRTHLLGKSFAYSGFIDSLPLSVQTEAYHILSMPPTDPRRKPAADAIKNRIGSAWPDFQAALGETGQLYRVDIPEDDKFLAWDKPFFEQPENVQKALLDSHDPYVLEALTTRPVLNHDYYSYMGQTYNDPGEALDDNTPAQIIMGRRGAFGTSPKEIAQTLSHLGIKGIVYHSDFHGLHKNYVVFDDNDITVEETFFQSHIGFYSQLSTAIDAMNFRSMPASDLAARIPKINGIKTEEIDDLAILDWLNSLTGKVRKEQVLQFIQDGGPKLQEVVKCSETWAVWDGDSEQYFSSYAESVAYAEENLIEINEDSVFLKETEGDTKFARYQSPGGENYREVLMTLPVVRTDKTYERWLVENFTGEDTPEARSLYEIQLKPGVNHKSSHWSEPNVIAHFRLNDRTDSNGNKVLHVEEIQSDWHQEGRRNGYKAQALPHGWKVREAPSLAARVGNYWAVYDEHGTVKTQAPTTKAAVDYALSGLPGTPNAPFKKSWPMLAFKRILRMAAEQGYDTVSWTPGEIQATRYDLSQHLSGIQYEPEYKNDTGNKTATFDFCAFDKNGKEVIARCDADLDWIEHHVGKEIAQKIANGEGTLHEDGIMMLSGLDLKVGGDGMNGFYDKILPAEVGKYVKKWGVCVSLGTIAGHSDKTAADDTLQDICSAWTVPITANMRSDILRGQPLYQHAREPRAEYIPDERCIRFRNADLSSFVHESGHFFLDTYGRIAASTNAPEAVTRDMQTILDWLGAGDPAAWVAMTTLQQRPFHERFAQAFEQYLLDGMAPDPALQPVFARIRNWMLEVYQTLFAHEPPPKDVRDVFDRWLGKKTIPLMNS